MKFRPCIDLHSGVVKQIVGSTLTDKESDSQLAENFASTLPASHYAAMYKDSGLTGGHVIMLGPGNDDPATLALNTYPQGLQVGGGVNLSNAEAWLAKGASHVIVTSFVFAGGEINMANLTSLVTLVGKDRIVLDLSCRKKPAQEGQLHDDKYYVVTDRWQKYTSFAVTPESLAELAQYCDEFLVHGVENEGKRCGILDDLVELLACSPIPCTYAGGVSALSDMDRVEALGQGKVDLTIGSALDIFGGDLAYADVVAWHNTHSSRGQTPAQPDA